MRLWCIEFLIPLLLQFVKTGLDDLFPTVSTKRPDRQFIEAAAAMRLTFSLRLGYCAFLAPGNPFQLDN